MARIELSVTKSFQSLEVILGVSLDIEDGAFEVFVGPSGCGSPRCSVRWPVAKR